MNKVRLILVVLLLGLSSPALATETSDTDTSIENVGFVAEAPNDCPDTGRSCATSTDFSYARGSGQGPYTMECQYWDFDVSAIPDGDVVTSAVVEVDVDCSVCDEDGSFELDYGSGACSTSEFDLNISPNISSTSLACSGVAGGVDTFTLTDFTGISKTGTTYIKMCNDGWGTAPSTCSAGKSNDDTCTVDEATTPPKLIVQHEVPTATPTPSPMQPPQLGPTFTPTETPTATPTNTPTINLNQQCPDCRDAQWVVP